MEHHQGRFFVPVDSKEHERGNKGENVPDFCANCGNPFMEHSNGECPKDEESE